MRELARTESVCPNCLEIIAATIFERNGKVWMKKACQEHGEFEDLYSGSYEWYMRTARYARDGKGIENPQIAKQTLVCPKDCGLCRAHLSHSALANIVLTNRCDLNCWYCFYYSGRVGYVYEPTLEQIEEMVEVLKEERPIACNAIQLTGGEPTLREDLIDIIKMVKSHGIDHIQLNTNGIRLSQDPDLVKEVRRAGTNTLYLSFDGVTEKSNPKNHWEIPSVIENSREAGLGIVLVPAVIKSVNDHEVGDIVKFALMNIDIIRGVIFQPVALVGRMPREELERYRITIPDVIALVEEATGGEIAMGDFFPVPASMVISDFIASMTKRPVYELSSHFACGAATYVVRDDGRPIPFTRFIDIEGLLEYLDEKTAEPEAGRSMIGAESLLEIGKFIDEEKKPEDLDVAEMIFNMFAKHDHGAIGQFHMKPLLIGMMHFMDLYNYDIERVKRCCIHYAMTDRRIIPFCAFNVIPEWYRDKNQQTHGISFEDWERRSGRSLKADLYKRDIPNLRSSEAYQKFVRQIGAIREGKWKDFPPKK